MQGTHIRTTTPAGPPSVGASCSGIFYPLLIVVNMPIRHRRKIRMYRAIRGELGIVNDGIPGTHAQAPPGVRDDVLS